MYVYYNLKELKMVKKKRLELDANLRFLKDAEGRMYAVKHRKDKKIDGIEHPDKIIFEEISQKEVNEKQKMIDFVKEKLTASIPPEKIAEEIATELDISQLKKLYKIMQKKDVKIKKQDGCFGLLVDGGKYNKVYLQVRE